MKILLTLTILLISELTFSQIVIKGRVLDYYNKTPLNGAKIFNNNGVLTDLDGRFELNVDNNSNVSLSLSGYIDLNFLCPDNMDTLLCDFYMISIEPYKLCLADGFIKHLFWKEPICSNYSRKMDKIWIKRRHVDGYTPLNWRLDCLGSYEFIENQGSLKMKYKLVFCNNFYDYRKYGEMTEKDYINCSIEN